MLYIPSYAPYGVQEEKNEMSMNQYGNNLIAPYGQNDYSPFFNGRSTYVSQQQNNTPTNNLLWVQGIEGAKALMLSPNSKVICLDSEIENRAYIKIADDLGATKLRKFELIEINDAETTSKDLSDYVRKDELQQLIQNLLPQREEVTTNESVVQSTQQPTTIVKRTVNK